MKNGLLFPHESPASLPKKAKGEALLPRLRQYGKVLWGTGQDASILYDGTNMVFDSQEVGTGDFIFSNGNVGIGNTAPTEKLEVEGNFSVGTSLVVSTNGEVGRP